MSENHIFYYPCHATSTEEWLPHKIPCVYATSSIQGRQLVTNQKTTHGLHRDRRAHRDPNRLKKLHPSIMYPRAHMSTF
jgi:hypothetical protein